MLLISPVLSATSSIMPEGLENVYLNMPIKELIAIRKNIKSDTTVDYCFEYGHMFCKWYKDPNNPKHLQNINVHLFKENYSFLFFDTVRFNCTSNNLSRVVVDGGINTRKKRREYPKKRDEFILYALKKWGRPDQLLVGDEKFSGTGRHDYYSITMNWLKGGTIIHAEFPLGVEEYFKSLSMIEKSLNALHNIADNYPRVQLNIGFRWFREHRGFGAEPFGDDYKPRQIVNREEADKLLKSIGFDELLKRAIGDTPSVIPKGLENVYLDMPIKELVLARKNIKSGNIFDYCVSDGPLFCKWYKTPYNHNPENTGQSPNNHLFKENYDFLFFDMVWFGCSSTNLHNIGLEGDINTQKKQREFPKNRDEFILYAIKTWREPDQLFVSDQKVTRTGRHDYYSITMNWIRVGIAIHAEFPLAVDEYFKSISMTEKPLNTLSDITTNYPKVRIDMLSGGPNAGPFLDIYKPRQIVNKKETDKLLKSIGFDELLKRALAK